MPFFALGRKIRVLKVSAKYEATEENLIPCEIEYKVELCSVNAF